jgi:hypothetical protein
MGRGTRRSLALAALAVAMLPAVARAAQPIEGRWHYSGGIVLVEPTASGSYRGVVVRSTRFAKCLHPAGERMWTIAAGGDAHGGTHQWFADPDCTPRPGGLATWTVREEGDRFVLRFCTAPPGAGAPDADNPARVCSDLERAKSVVRTAPRACSGSACLGAPQELTRLGCLPRKPFTYRFPFSLSRKDRRRLRVVVARFALDWKPNGVDRRSPFVARVDGSRITRGATFCAPTSASSCARAGARSTSGSATRSRAARRTQEPRSNVDQPKRGR